MKTRLLVDKITRQILVFILGMMVINVIWQVFTRYILALPSSWTEELTRFLMIWLGILGAAYVSGQKKHIAITLLPSKMKPSSQRKLDRFIAVLIIIFVLSVFVLGGSRLVYITFVLEQYSPALNLPLGIVYSILPISGLLIIFYKINDLVTSQS